ncbi:transposable element Tc3 transposase [Trichonephila clavipes]|nr:transposable element Tc3 transposase [Trichonephila clavipes]
MELAEKTISENHREEIFNTSGKPSISLSPLRSPQRIFQVLFLLLKKKSNPMRQCTLCSRKKVPEVGQPNNVTVNGDWYRAMVTNFFILELNNHDAQELWFQQDGATCHTARDTIDLLKHTFGDRLISRFGLVIWPPRSCDLTPLDYFLWGYVKSLVYADKPQTLDHLEDNIRLVIADIRPQMLEKVIENWTSR